MIVTIGFVLISRVIIFGFSEELSRAIKMYRWRRLNDEFITFVIISVLPVLVHYIMCLFSTHRNANQSV
ncbi:MAG TPA: hypothetical protein DFK19_01430 [Ochrobactrum sp.]|nr:hypothetical protein [Ochrobactrum sp.]